MNHFLNGFADELVKTGSAKSTVVTVWKGLSPEVRSAVKWSGILSGVNLAMNPGAGVGSAVKGGAGFIGGDLATRAAMRHMGVGGPTTRMIGGLVGGHMAGNALQKMGAAAKTHLTPNSSNVQGYSYDASTQKLSVTYKGGATYSYAGVPPAAFKKLRRNKSVGKTINRTIKAPGYKYEKVAFTLIEAAILSSVAGGAIGAATAPEGQRLKRGLLGVAFGNAAVANSFAGASRLPRDFVRRHRTGLERAILSSSAIGGVAAGRIGVEKTAKKKKQKNYKCKFCKDPATKGVIWAEGHGIVPCCDKHLAKGRASIDDPSDIDLIRDLRK